MAGENNILKFHSHLNDLENSKVQLSNDDLFLALGVLITQLSICNWGTLSHYCSILLYTIWGIWSIKIISLKNFKFNGTAFMMIAMLFFTFIQNKLFFMLGYYRTGGLGVARNFIACIFFYVLGVNVKKSRHTVPLLFASYLTGVVLLLFIRWISGVMMNDVDKNAIGAVSGGGLFSIYFFFKYGRLNKSQKIILYLIGFIIIITLFLMHTRTPLAASFIALSGVLALRHKIRKSLIVITISCIILIVLYPYLLKNEILYNYLQGVQSSNELTLNSMSSNRLDRWYFAWEEIKEYPWIGLGGWAYVDCFPLYILRQGGIISGVIIGGCIYGKFLLMTLDARDKWMSFQKSTTDTHLQEICVIFILYYSAISIFEGYVPMGPGVSIFFLWLVLGLYDDYNNQIQSVKS